MKSIISHTNVPWFVAHSPLIEVEAEQIKLIPHSVMFISEVAAMSLMPDRSPYADAATTSKARN